LEAGWDLVQGKKSQEKYPKKIVKKKSKQIEK